MEIAEKNPAEKLLRSLKSTSASRFNASKRLSLRDQRRTRLTAFVSAYVIALTILPYFIKLPSYLTDVFNLITVFFSIVILVSSLLQYSSGDVVNSEQHHRAGLEIDELQRDLRAQLASISTEELKRLNERYNAVLQKFSVNHDDVDYFKYQLERPQDFPWLTRLQRLRFWVRIVMANILPQVALVLVTALFLALVTYAYYINITGREFWKVPASAPIDSTVPPQQAR